MSSLAQKINILAWMTRCDFKLRDQGTLLGFLWTLLNPILLFAVLYLVFNAWFAKLVDHYGIYLILGIVNWNFFTLATSNTLTIFERKRQILKSFAVSPATIPLAAVLTVFASYFFESLIALLICSLWVSLSLSGVAWYLALLPLYFVLVLGTSLLLATTFIFFRDVAHLWSIALRIGFFLTPVFYPLDLIAENNRFILALNPLYHLFYFFRQAVLEGTVSIDWNFFYLVSFTVILFAIALKLSLKYQDKLVDLL